MLYLLSIVGTLRRQHIPELRRSFFQRVPLPDGDLDYRFAIAAMLDAGYDGYLAVEGAREGDALSQDRRGAEYIRQLLAELAQAEAPRPLMGVAGSS